MVCCVRERALMPSSPRIAIIGAGVAGLTCGHTLWAAGFAPVVFEKSRGLGGRMATRWTRDGLFFDHGAQYVTARSPEFLRYVEEAQASGHTAVWDRESDEPSRSERYVGTPGMKDLATPLAAGLEVRLQTRVSNMRQTDEGWALETDASTREVFDHVVCAMPSPQTRDLLPASSPLVTSLSAVEVAPCWAMMLAFDDALPVQFDWQRVDTGPIAWIARNSAKPTRSRTHETWVVHASPAWSEAHLEREADDVLADLLSAFAEIAGGRLPSPVYSTAHRWRYALTTKPLGQAHLMSEDQSLLICGDWCLGGRVEAAFESGQAAGQALAEVLAERAA